MRRHESTSPALLAAAAAVLLLAVWLGFPGPSAEAQAPPQRPGMGMPMPWSQQVANFMPLFGEGNWIIVSETAFPLLAKNGVETVPVRENLADAVNQIVGLLQSNNRLRGVYHLPIELDVVAAGGGEPEAYAGALRQILPESAIVKAPAAEILDRILEGPEIGRVLVIKTDSEIPYGTLAIELKRGYWSEEQEAELRKALGASGG